MKKILFLFCLLFSLKTYATDTLISKSWQHSANISFTAADISQNFIFAYIPYYKNHSLRLGLRLNVSNYDYYRNSASNTVYYQRGFAKNFGQKFGLNVGYQYNFKLKKTANFAPYVFYDFEAARLALRTITYFYAGVDSLGTEYYAKIPIEYEAGYSFLNTIGFGAKLAVTKNINFDVALGWGISFAKYSGRGYTPMGMTVFSVSHRNFLGLDWYMVGLDGLPMIRLGLTYTFAKK